MLLLALGAGNFVTQAAETRPVEPEVFVLHAMKQQLLVTEPDGKQVASLPLDTLGKVVRVNRYSVEVTYGRTSEHESTLTLTSSNSNPKKLLSFRLNGHHIEMEPKNGELLVSLTLVIPDEDDDTVKDKDLRLVATSFRAPVWIDGKPMVPAEGTVAAGGEIPSVRFATDNGQAMAAAMDKDPLTIPSDPLSGATGNTGTFGDLSQLDGMDGIAPISHIQLPVIGFVRVNLNPRATTPF